MASMIFTGSFRRQHGEILEITERLSNLLDPYTLGKDTGGVRSMLSRLAAKLSVHLTLEDKSLYPALISHPDIEVKSAANRFISEMGNLQRAFEEYARRWGAHGAIEEAPVRFINETGEMLSALKDRIEKEDRELYALCDILPPKELQTG